MKLFPLCALPLAATTMVIASEAQQVNRYESGLNALIALHLLNEIDMMKPMPGVTEEGAEQLYRNQLIAKLRAWDSQHASPALREFTRLYIEGLEQRNGSIYAKLTQRYMLYGSVLFSAASNLEMRAMTLMRKGAEKSNVDRVIMRLVQMLRMELSWLQKREMQQFLTLFAQTYTQTHARIQWGYTTYEPFSEDPTLRAEQEKNRTEQERKKQVQIREAEIALAETMLTHVESLPSETRAAFRAALQHMITSPEGLGTPPPIESSDAHLAAYFMLLETQGILSMLEVIKLAPSEVIHVSL